MSGYLLMMKELIRKLLKEHEGYFGNVITHDLPVELDNALYTLIHFLGKMDFEDVTNFAQKATPEQVEYLSELVSNFPSQQHELIINAGGFKELRNSDLYTEILDFITGIDDKDFIRECNIKTFKQLLYEEGGINQELRIGDIQQAGVTPEMKKALFKHWDRTGSPEWKSLKLVGFDAFTDSAFDNVADIVYPILRIEWEGGIRGTQAYDYSQDWGHKFRDDEYKGGHRNDFEYRIIPVGYDFGFDDSVNFGDSGYSCWNILVEFRPNGHSPMMWDGLEIGEDLFPLKNYPMKRYNSYDSSELDLIEDLWDEEIHTVLGDYFRQFCQVGIKVIGKSR